jgi:hypothetical protein
MRAPAEVRRATLDYKAALENAAQAQDDLASQLALLAGELKQQGQHELADMLRQTSHEHRASSIKNRALAASRCLTRQAL